MGVLKNAMMGCAKWLKLVGGIFTIFMGLITIRDSIGLVFLVFGTILIGFVYLHPNSKKLCVYKARIGFDLIGGYRQINNQEYI